MANIYLEYTKMYGVRFADTYIRLLSLTNENEISIFIVPNFQNMSCRVEIDEKPIEGCLGYIYHGSQESVLKKIER